MVSDFVSELGKIQLFTQQLFSTFRKSPPSRDLVFDQIWKVTVQSFPTTALAGFFVGGIMSVQFSMQVKQFGALGYLGGLSTSGTIREIGPLLIAFMLSGKVGAFTSAELGTMQVTEQIDAIRCLGANPLQEIILPRFIGIVFSSFFLLLGGLIMSIFGGLLIGVLFTHITPEEYYRHIPTIVNGFSIVTGLFKCFVFAFVLAIICTYKGYHTTGGAQGVGRSVVSTAVVTMVSIVFADWLTTFIAESFIRMLGVYS